MIVKQNLQGNYIVDDEGVLTCIPIWDSEKHAEMTAYLAKHPECFAPYVPTGLDYQVLIIEREQYLQSTDWYAVRYGETGQAIPAEIATARQNARDEISRLRGLR